MSQIRAHPQDLALWLRKRASDLGFQALGLARARPLLDDAERLEGWLRAGHQGRMGYLARWSEVRRDPAHQGMLEGARTIVSLAMAYPLEPPERGLARHLSAYARGPDYHAALGARLRQLLAELRERAPEVRGRALVDTAPLLERAWAREAGLGAPGRNTCLIHPELGSALVLGELVLTIELEPSVPSPFDPCGGCRACVEACPTGALASPEGRDLDARRCLSYWTIEAPEDIPPELAGHPKLFGCDECQLACPWNRRARPATDSALSPLARYESVTLEDLAQMELPAIEALIAGTALTRAGAEALRARARLLIELKGSASSSTTTPPSPGGSGTPASLERTRGEKPF